MKRKNVLIILAIILIICGTIFIIYNQINKGTSNNTENIQDSDVEDNNENTENGDTNFVVCYSDGKYSFKKDNCLQGQDMKLNNISISLESENVEILDYVTNNDDKYILYRDNGIKLYKYSSSEIIKFDSMSSDYNYYSIVFNNENYRGILGGIISKVVDNNIDNFVVVDNSIFYDDKNSKYINFSKLGKIKYSSSALKFDGSNENLVYIPIAVTRDNSDTNYGYIFNEHLFDLETETIISSKIDGNTVTLKGKNYDDKFMDYYIKSIDKISYTDGNVEDLRGLIFYNDKDELSYYNVYDKTEYTFAGKYEFHSSTARSGMDTPLMIRNNENLVVISINENDINYYGLIDIDNGEVLIKPIYEFLIDTYDGNFVAVKNNKTGIIDKNNKVLVNFEYDFIDINRGYYVVCKDKKLAIMDKNYRLVTGFEFDYQVPVDTPNKEYSYKLCCGGFNSFVSYKTNIGYILITNYEGLPGTKYLKNEAYLIDNYGKYTVINQFNQIQKNEYILFESEASTKYVVYNINTQQYVSTISLPEQYNGMKLIVNILEIENDIVHFTIYDYENYDYKNGNELYYNIKTGEKVNK